MLDNQRFIVIFAHYYPQKTLPFPHKKTTGKTTATANKKNAKKAKSPKKSTKKRKKYAIFNPKKYDFMQNLIIHNLNFITFADNLFTIDVLGGVDLAQIEKMICTLRIAHKNTSTTLSNRPPIRYTLDLYTDNCNNFSYY